MNSGGLALAQGDCTKETSPCVKSGWEELGGRGRHGAELLPVLLIQGQWPAVTQRCPQAENGPGSLEKVHAPHLLLIFPSQGACQPAEEKPLMSAFPRSGRALCSSGSPGPGPLLLQTGPIFHWVATYRGLSPSLFCVASHCCTLWLQF